MTGVELLTPEPIGLGTKFLAHLGNGMDMLVDITEFDRPHRVGTRTTSSMMETSGRLTFASEAAATVVAWDWQVQPSGSLLLTDPAPHTRSHQGSACGRLCGGRGGAAC